MGNNVSDKFDYHFMATSPEDYELVFSAKTKDSYLTKIFKKSQKALRRAIGININGKPADITSFDLPPQYLKIVSLRMGKIVKGLFKELESDGISCVSQRIKKGSFTKAGGDWDIKLYYGGNYVDKR